MTKVDVLDSFKKICEIYESPIEKLVSKEQVNGWCNEKTNGKIPTIIDDITGITMLLLNAVYFKGEWESKFKEKNTEKMPFFNYGKEQKEVDMMYQKEEFDYYERDNVQAVKLDYMKDNMFALVILPAKGEDINEYAKTLTDDKIHEMLTEGKKFRGNVKLFLPKVKVEFSSGLQDYLKNLGMKSAFGNADFSALSKVPQKIDEVIHKTFLNVDEDGTEAAGVTMAMMMLGCCPGEEEVIEKLMVVERPFLFLLMSRDLPKGNDIVFINKIEAL